MLRSLRSISSRSNYLNLTNTTIMTARTYSSPALTHLAAAVEKLTPLSLADTRWDNVGLMMEAPFPRVIPNGRKVIYLCIDLTPSVTLEALSNPSTSLILTYHPPIFSGLKSLTLSSPLQTSLLQIVASGISIYTIHTAADNAPQGTNDFMADAFVMKTKGMKFNQLVKVGALKAGVRPEGFEVEGTVGTGRRVDLKPLGLSIEDCIEVVKERMGLKHLQCAISPTGPKFIQSIAICAGSGSSVLKDAKADLWVTGELGHHEILAALSQGTHVLLCNHSASERPWLHQFAPRLEKAMNTLRGDATQGEEREYEVIVSGMDREYLEVV